MKFHLLNYNHSSFPLYTGVVLVMTILSFADIATGAPTSQYSVVSPATLRRTIEQAGPNALILVPARDYEFDRPLQLNSSICLQIEAGARLHAPDTALFEIHKGVRINIEGIGGQPHLISGSHVFDLETIEGDAAPSLVLSRLKLEGQRCLSGYEKEDKGGLDRLELRDCRLEASDRHIAFRHAFINTLRVEGCRFTSQAGTSYSALMLRCPMRHGVFVRHNYIEGVQVRALWLAGGTGSRFEGTGTGLPAAIIENNIIVGSPNKAPIGAKYVTGIMVIGEQLVIRGNIIRDFNRGEPVPGREMGQHIISEHRDTPVAGRWNKEDDKRLAGAAIYTKSRHAIVADNVCVNSGWRSVIEIKGNVDGNLVANNIVDGRSLSVEGSYGLETQTSESLWAGNLIKNMPDMAMKLQGGRSNTIQNNVFIRALRGVVGIYDGDFSKEMLLDNRFLEIDEPLSGHARSSGALLYQPSALIVENRSALPTPHDGLRGRYAVVKDEQQDTLWVCLKQDNKLIWQPIDSE